jgi:hypothetical protein
VSKTPSRRRRILVVATAIVVVLAGSCAAFVLAQPSSFRIARNRTIAAAPDRVAEEIVDMNRFAAWEPWASTGSARTLTYSTPASGEGAWLETRDAHGAARITVVSITSSRIEMRNDVAGGVAGPATSRQSFELRPVAGGTEVTWALENENDLMRRALWPFVDLEGRVGPDMEAALGRLEEAATSSP